MKKALLLFVICSFMISFTSAQLFYQVEVHYNNGNLEILDSDVIFSRVDVTNSSFIGDELVHTIDLVTKDGNLFYTEDFSIPITSIIHYGDSENITGSEIEYVTDVLFTLYLPYDPSVVSFEVYDSNDIGVVTYDTSVFATPDEVFDESIIPESHSDSESSEESLPLLYMLIFVIILIIVSFILYVFFKGNRKK